MSTKVMFQPGACIDKAIEFIMMECGGCGLPFMVPSEWKQKKVDELGSFSCPNGCSRVFIGKTKAQKIQDQLDLERRQHSQQADNLINQVLQKTSELNKVNRQLKKVKNGVCPVHGCQRSFHSLADHLAHVHPEYTGKAAPAVKRKKNK